jgi:hypothetical protein
MVRSPFPLRHQPHRPAHRNPMNRVDAWRTTQCRAAELGMKGKIGHINLLIRPHR